MVPLKGRRSPLAPPLLLLPLTLALFFLLCQVAPASGNYDKYLQFGVHALQMQDWKKQKRFELNQLQTQATEKLQGVEALNATAYAAIDQVSKHVSGLNDSVEYIMASLNALSNSGAPALSTPESAFQAYVTSSGYSTTMSPSNPLIYANEKLDENSDYSTSTGLFTAPLRGLYWLHITFNMGSGYYEAYITVKRASGAAQKLAYVKYYVSQETAATTLVVLEPGDTVGVYPKLNYGSVTVPGGAVNTFCGYLVAKYKEPVLTPPSTTTTAAAATTASGGGAATTTAAPAIISA